MFNLFVRFEHYRFCICITYNLNSNLKFDFRKEMSSLWVYACSLEWLYQYVYLNLTIICLNGDIY